MFDKGLAIEVLKQILQATHTIAERFKPVNSVEDFTETPAGMEKLDSICMLLIAVGENLKNIDKITSGKLLPKYPQVDWKKAKGLGILSAIIILTLMQMQFFTYAIHILSPCDRQYVR